MCFDVPASAAAEQQQQQRQRKTDSNAIRIRARSCRTEPVMEVEVKTEIIEEDFDVKPPEHKILKGKALAARLREAREEGILINKKAREELLLKAEYENANAFRELCSLFDKSLEFSTKVASSLEEERNESSLKSGSSNEVFDESLFSGGTLRDYQRDGAAWMIKLRSQGLNGILADEMGLGKTAQSIAMISHLVATGSRGPFLVLGPLSTLRNWENEIHRFSPSLPVVVLHGTKAERKEILRTIGQKHSLKDGSGRSIFPIVVAPYHNLVADLKQLIRFKWAFLVVDEASVIKNEKAAISRSVSSLYVTGKLLLTGTPLQNNIKELFNLLHFCVPNIFADYRLFEGWIEELNAHRDEGSFGDGDSCQLVSTMHCILAPFFLRRTKESVEIGLPPKKHIIVYCPMTRLQQTYYKAILSAKQREFELANTVEIFEDGKRPLRTCRRASIYGGATDRKRASSGSLTPAKRQRWLSSLDSDTSDPSEAGHSNASLPVDVGSPDPLDEIDEEERLLREGMIKFSSASMINILCALRKTVAHPWLVHREKSWGSDYPHDRDALLERSGKMQVFDLLLRQLLKRNHKVLVFSGFTSILDLVTLYLELSGIEYLYLKGTVQLNERQRDIDAFNDPNSKEKVFLISTRAGGMGINLTGADTVIFFDTDWNPQADLQAADRCHRIGQTRKVVIYRLIARGTVDERILDVATDKRRLEKLVMKCGKFEKVNSIKDISGGDLLQVINCVDWDAALDLDLLDPSRIEALADRDLVFKGENDTGNI